MRERGPARCVLSEYGAAPVPPRAGPGGAAGRQCRGPGCRRGPSGWRYVTQAVPSRMAGKPARPPGYRGRRRCRALQRPACPSRTRVTRGRAGPVCQPGAGPRRPSPLQCRHGSAGPVGDRWATAGVLSSRMPSPAVSGYRATASAAGLLRPCFAGNGGATVAAPPVAACCRLSESFAASVSAAAPCQWLCPLCRSVSCPAPSALPLSCPGPWLADTLARVVPSS